MCLLEGERGNRQYFKAACSAILIRETTVVTELDPRLPDVEIALV